MEKYQIGPEEAIRKLRYYRPQSMQFNPDDWFQDPFIIRHESAYQRNLLQERYVHCYYNQKLLPKWKENEIEMPSVSSSSTLQDIHQYASSENSADGIEPFSESNFVFNVEFDNDQVDAEVTELLKKLNDLDLSQPIPDDACFACRKVLAVGPCPIIVGQEWPGKDAEIIYM